MVNLSATAAAVLVLLLFVVGMVAMVNGWLLVAGFSLLSVALVIYFRETRLVDG
ncbi:hypothetical protein [Halopelagius fulvigenes]|uniref:Uncharacterized protein n=1 Tax=Halopelagius fulvigenes TaxID=1198324 RepID=A0ABD5TZJ4_9EURY